MLGVLFGVFGFVRIRRGMTLLFSYSPSGKDMPESEFAAVLEEVPKPLSQVERDAWTAQLKGVCLSSDAFFPFRDNVDRAKQV